jgi:hypothetical protein
MGCDDSQKRRLGNWADGGSIGNSYESVIPREEIQKLAGFPDNERYNLPRVSLEVPQELLDMVFPSLNQLLSGESEESIQQSLSLDGFKKVICLL